MTRLVSKLILLLFATSAGAIQFTLNHDLMVYGNQTNRGSLLITNEGGVFRIYSADGVGLVVYDVINDNYFSFTNGLLAVDGITTINGTHGFTNELVGFWGYGIGLSGIRPAGLNATNSGTANQVFKRINDTQGYWAADNSGGGVGTTITNAILYSDNSLIGDMQGGAFADLSGQSSLNFISRTLDDSSSVNTVDWDSRALTGGPWSIQQISGNVLLTSGIITGDGSGLTNLTVVGSGTGIQTNGGTGIDNTFSNLTVISSEGTMNALLIKTPPGGNIIPIFAITNVSMANTHFLHVDNNGELYANAIGATNLNASALASGTVPDARLSGAYNTAQIVSTNILYRTNAATTTIVLNNNYQLYSTNNNIVIGGVANVSSTETRWAVVNITNSSGATVSLALPASWRTGDGLRTYYVTNGSVSILSVNAYANLMTNAIVRPLW